MTKFRSDSCRRQPFKISFNTHLWLASFFVLYLTLLCCCCGSPFFRLQWQRPRGKKSRLLLIRFFSQLSESRATAAFPSSCWPTNEKRKPRIVQKASESKFHHFQTEFLKALALHHKNVSKRLSLLSLKLWQQMMMTHVRSIFVLSVLLFEFHKEVNCREYFPFPDGVTLVEDYSSRFSALRHRWTVLAKHRPFGSREGNRFLESWPRIFSHVRGLS